MSTESPACARRRAGRRQAGAAPHHLPRPHPDRRHRLPGLALRRNRIKRRDWPVG